jgi:DNA-binding NarL/FixJ family response regulator
MNPIKVMIVEDNPSFRRLIKAVLETEKDIQISAEADNLEQLKNLIQQNPVDVVLLDMSLGRPEAGLEFLRELRQAGSSANCIVLSAHGEDTYAAKSLQAGAKGYLSKDKTVQHLAKAIRCVASGQEFLSSR